MKDLNDEGEKMGEGKWNESDLWQREAEEMVCKRNLSCRMRFRVRNKSEKPAAARCAVSAMPSAGRWHFSA